MPPPQSKRPWWSCAKQLVGLSLVTLVGFLVHEAESSGSLSSSSLLAQNVLSIPKDRDGDPDYCFITRQHTACNIKTKVS